MKEALPLWNEVEQETSTHLLHPGTFLIFGDPIDPYFKKVLAQIKG